MKFCIVGPGIQPIPPTGWGAIEILTDDIRKSLQKAGHQAEIINVKNMKLGAALINHMKPDVVHIQYDEHIDIAKLIKCKNIVVTSHFAYMGNRQKWGGYYYRIFSKTTTSDVRICCLSSGIKATYIDGCVEEDRLFVVPNGVRTDLFDCNIECPRPNDSIYLAKVENRKRQYIYHGIENLYYAGRIVDEKFPQDHPRHLGEWSKEFLYKNLTNFANLALLSDGEAHPLVCTEAMAAGLGVVVSEPAKANLDLDLPFIDVIPDEKLDDTDYVASILEKNRKISVTMRDKIREYAVNNFDWSHVINNIYVPEIKRIMNVKE